MTIVDAHHHLLDPSARAYPWIAGDYESLLRRFDVDDLRAAAAGCDVDRTVVVQTVADVEETSDFLRAAAASDGLVAGVVGWVDLTAPDVGAEVDRLRASVGGDRLVGIRHQAHDEPDGGWLARPDVLRGLRQLAGRGLVFDLLVRSRELPAALAAVTAVEDLAFVVDHGAKPDIAAGRLEPWRSLLSAVAERPNVACKISGLATEADWSTWTTSDLRPYVETLLALFGPERLMWGSDWPVCTLATSYAEELVAAQDCLTTLSPSESAAVFSGTAARVYGLLPSLATAT